MFQFALRASLALCLAASAVPVLAGGGRDVELKAPDDLKLAATYFPAAQPGPGILLLHQCNRDRTAWNGLAPLLAAKGFHVLTLDYRGYGQSGGARHTELPFPEQGRLTDEVWPGDVDTAYAYLRAQKGVDPQAIGAAGASCGVNQSIHLSRRHPEVKALALLSGNTNRDGRLHLKKSGVAVFSAGADDDGGAADVMAWLESLSGNPENRFLRYALGGHGTDMFKARPELPGDIAAWFEAILLGRRTAGPSAPRAPLPPTVRLLAMLDEPSGAAGVAAALAADRKKDPRGPTLEPGFVNQLGYAAIQAGDTRSAVAIMTINTEALPQSSNAWDSLADALLADGQAAKAREYSEKVLQLVDEDAGEPADRKDLIRQSAQGKLDQLKAAAEKR